MGGTRAAVARVALMAQTIQMAAAVATCAMISACSVVAADDASVRANAGILMSRSMDVKDRVGAAESLARYSPRAAVPTLIEALNETSEPVRRAAARGLWTIAQNENAEDAAAARAAMPALRIALGDVSVSVAMNAAGALERLGEPATVLAEPRRKALRTPGPYGYERFLAARGLIGIDPAVALTPYVLDWLFAEYRRLDSSDSSGARDNIRIANAGLMRLVQTGDRGVLVALENELKADRPGTSDLLRAMAIAKPLPDQFARTLVIEANAPRAETVATAFELMAKLDDPASLNEWVPAAARALSDPRRQAGAARALKDVAGKTPLGMPELARLAESAAPDATRVIALGALGDASDATRDRPAAVVAAAKPAALQAFRLVLARDPAAPPFEEAARALRFTERDFNRSAAMYLEALKQNPDVTAQAQLLDYIGQAHSAAGMFADELRPYASASDPRVRQAAIAALDSIKPSWRESGERTAAVTVGSLPKVAPPQPGAKGADLAKFYGAVRDGDSAAIARLVNARNVNAPLILPNGTAAALTPMGGALQHCGLPHVAPAKIVAAVAQLVALGADPEQRSSGGSTLLDHAKAACPPEVQEALLGRPRK